MPRKKLTVFEESRESLGNVMEQLVSYRNTKEGKEINPAAIGILKEAINRIEDAVREISRFEKFLYFAGKGDTLFIVNNETGTIQKGNIEQIMKSVRDIQEVI